MAWPQSLERVPDGDNRCTAGATHGIAQSAHHFFLAACRYVFKSALLGIIPCVAALAADGRIYAGVEFLGSSLVSKTEIEKVLGIKPGASADAAERAMTRVQAWLERRRLHPNLEMVAVDPNKVYISVDVKDEVSSALPTRKLRFPYHIPVRSEKPYMLLQSLGERLTKLKQEGRPYTEELKEGVKFYSDEPANLIANQLAAAVPVMTEELLTVINNDPDPERRAVTIDLMNWAGSVPDVAHVLVESLDDTDAAVRVSVDRYLYPRLALLGDDFEYQRLIEALSRQLRRPSHQDRSKAAYVLLALAQQRPELVTSMAVFTEQRLKELAENSVLPTVRVPARELLSLFQMKQ